MRLDLRPAVATVRAPALAARPFPTPRRGRLLTLAIALMATAMGPSTAAAASGDLDPAFGGTGAIVEHAGVGASGLVVQPDGRPVVIGEGAGSGPLSSTRRFALARFGTDGVLDPTFGSGGLVGTAPIPARRLARQADGKLVGAGVTPLGDGQSGFAIGLVQWHAHGVIDTIFGVNGVATSRSLWPLDLLPGPSVSAMVVEPNGKITVAGGASNGAIRHLLLARFNPEGTADLSFGASGYVSLAVDGAVHALIAQPDGRLVVAGETAEAATGAGSCMTLWRFEVDGTVDPAFGVGGRSRACSDAASGASALLLQADGKLVAAGFGNDAGTGHRFAQVTRFEADGSIDVAFGSTGSVRVSDRGGDVEALAVAVQSDGRLVVAGTGFMSARFDGDGFIDLGYGIDGIVRSAVPTGDATQLVIQSDGRIVAAGATVDGGKQPAIVVARVLGSDVAAAASGRLIEYVNSENFPGATGGHYFYTLDGSAEAQAVDSGAAGAFVRTGQSWPAGGTSAVARFYGSMQPGPNSHFYTANVGEADGLLALQAVPVPTTVQQWNYEKLAFAVTPAVEQADGARTCPRDRAPVHRAYNNAWNGGVRNPWDSNHRYSTNPAVILTMIQSYGWAYEGVVFCVLAG
jgi:uncharacterized delta-60 repeat protein